MFNEKVYTDIFQMYVIQKYSAINNNFFRLSCRLRAALL
jgi:hypothetical protein